MPERSTRSSGSPRLVVGVGASAGGLEAFKQLLGALPGDTGMAFIFVQHLDPTHESILASLLASVTTMTVVNADDGAVLEPDHVYVIRPNTFLAVQGGRIRLSEPVLHRGVRLPVDHLFRSLATEYGSLAAAVVLSGAGSDGSAGLREVKEYGGLTISQDPEACAHTGMPKSAIDQVGPDLVLDVAAIPDAIERFASVARTLPRESARAIGSATTPSRPLEPDELERLASLLEAQVDLDVRGYKSGTIERRVGRRMVLSGFDSVDAYLDYLAEADVEQRALGRDLLISVTSFFRDPEVFRAARELVVDRLVNDAPPGSTLRAWVPACATGEEAYSFAMEFLDAIDASGKALDLRMFATDVDEDALAVAREGVYPSSAGEHVGADRLRRYFHPLEGGGFRVRGGLRDVISFAVHDLTQHSPFSRMDFVSCRNVLIYLRPAMQKHVLQVLHFALRPTGYLVLGTAETVGALSESFAAVAPRASAYRKVGRSRPMPTRGVAMRAGGPPEGGGVASRDGRHDLARRAVLDALVPPSVVVSPTGVILFVHGDLRPFLRFPEGEDLRLEFGKLVMPTLATRARGAVFQCRKHGEPVTLVAKCDDGPDVRITVAPAPSIADEAVVIAFESAAGPEAAVAPVVTESIGDASTVELLEQELHATREDLRSTVEELESSNEELRASNDESLSMNEELQSSNEELEATTEELRALNEELTAVNTELREKVAAVERAHDDLSNFFASARVATLFLDDRMCIKRFTPAAADLLELEPGDVGRRITTLASAVPLRDLDRVARDVLDRMVPSTMDVESADGRWYSRQVLPYRTESRRIEGVVVSYLDVTDVKRAAAQLEVREHQQSMVAQTGMQALRENDLQAFLDRVARDVRRTLDVDLTKILELEPSRRAFLVRAGAGWDADVVGSVHVPTGSASQAGYTFDGGQPIRVVDLAEERRFSSSRLLESHGVTSGVSCVIEGGEQPYGILAAHSRARREFTTEDVYFLQAMASMIGTAIHRHQARLSLAVELTAATVLADAHSFEEAAPLLIEHLMAEIGASVGELWWDHRGEDPGAVTCLVRRCFAPLRPEAADDRLARDRYDLGEGFVGRALAQRCAVWCADLRNPAEFMRADGARALELESGVAFPIAQGNRVRGVVALFSRERLYANADMLATLEGIGRTIGDFVSRTDAQKRSERLAAIAASSHDAIIRYDFDYRVVEWLPGAERLFGYTEDEMLGESFVERIVPTHLRRELEGVNERIRRDEVVDAFETQRFRKDGSLVEVSVRSSPVKDAEGRVIGVSSVDRDISRQKRMERELVEADRQKDEFIAMLGHELRNPLSAMRAATELLRRADGADSDDAVAMLERQCVHMGKLLDGLLDVSRIIHGRIELERDRVDLVRLCTEVFSDIRGRQGEKALEFDHDLPDAPLVVLGDAVRLTQIVDNLLSNAAKYTSEGGRISMRLACDGDDAVITVADTGIGIERELLPHIFDPFRQAEQRLDRSQGGLGLGLSLVRTLTEMHGGAVDARSDGPGCGSEFVVRLPALPAGAEFDVPRDPRPASSPPAVDNDALRVLVIEDHEDSATALTALLQTFGHDVDIASCGENGVSLADSGEPDVVLCDVGLPDITGYEVARRIRERHPSASMRLIALTGYGREEDRERCLAAGFDLHLTKPIDPGSLREIVGGGAGDASGPIGKL